MTSAISRMSRVTIATIGATAIALTAAPALAGGYMKLGDIKGESKAEGPGKGGHIEIESWSWGESQQTRKGNVEYNWKVEEGEKAAKGDMVLKGSKIGENAPAGDPDRPLVAGRVANAGVEREMKESGEKGGTEDINIGVGELQEVTISKSMDAASPSQPAMKWDNVKQKQWPRGKAHDKHTNWVERASPAPRGSVRVKVKMPWPGCRVGTRYPAIELGDGVRTYKLHDAMVASCSGDADDRPTEEVAFYYNRISF